MELNITCRHLEDTAQPKAYAQGKFSRLERFYQALHKTDVILKEEDRQCQCEAILHIRNRDPEFVKSSGESMLEAIDLAIDKAEKLLKRLKQRRESRRHPAVKP